MSECRAGSDHGVQKQNGNRRVDERRWPHRLAPLSGLREVILVSGWPADVRADWIHAGFKPARGARVQSRSQRHALGEAEAGAPEIEVTPVMIEAGAAILRRWDRRIEDFEAQVFLAMSELLAVP
jgi:hypothetical protein